MHKQPQWFEYVRVHTPSGHVRRAEVECDSAEQFYALLNYWNRDDGAAGIWKFYCPVDWGAHGLQGRVFPQREVQQ